MENRIIIINGLSIDHAQKEKIKKDLAPNNQIKVYSPSYASQWVVGIEQENDWKNSLENFSEVKEVSDDVYVQLCTLAVYLGMKESDIKTYVFSVSYLGDSDNWSW